MEENNRMEKTRDLLKLEKVRKTTRPFRSDLNQIPYTGEVMNTAEVIIQQR